MVPGLCAVAKFLGPDWGDIVDSGIGLSYRLAMLRIGHGGLVQQPYVSVDYMSQSGTKNLSSECMRVRQNNRI
jgi:hypothetical protein